MNVTYLIDRHADLRPDATALIGGDGRRVDWRGFRDRIGRVAALLSANGITAGDRVGLLCANRSEFLEILLGCARIGAIAVPQNFRLAPAELRFQIENADLCFWFVDGLFRDLAEAASAGTPWAGIPRIGVADPQSDRPYEDMLASAEPVADLVPVPPDTTLGIFYTGGTTGLPKGVMLSHNNLLSNANHIAPLYGLTPDDVHLHTAPLFHLADLGMTFCQLIAGGSHVFQTAFRPAETCALIEEHRVTTVMLAPTMINMLLSDPAADERDLSSLSSLLYGGSPITAALLRRAMDRLPECDFLQGFGQTEATHTICALSPGDHRRATEQPELLQSCGKPVAGVHLRIVDEKDKPVGTGTVGELVIRGPTVMGGYWRNPGDTEAALRGGWLRTGDLGYRDDEGFVYLVDRRKDMIVSGAENVYSSEVENALAAHPDIVEAAVIGVPDEVYGERVHAVVVLRAGAETGVEALRAHCRSLIAGYKVPRSIDIAEVLPKTAAGKVAKQELRRAHWTGHDRQVT